MRLIKSLLFALVLSVGACAQTGGFLLQFQQGGTNIAGATYKKYALVNFSSGCTAAVSGGALNITCTGVAGNPGGSAGQLQWNSAGTAFAGITQWTTNGTTTLTAGSTAVLALGAMPLSGITFPTASTTGFLRVTTATGALTSGELSGDCTTSGSLSITCTKTSGVAFSGLATAAIPLTVANGGTGTSSTLTGVLRGGSPLTASEISGDCTTSGSNAITCTKTNGTALSGLATAAIPLTIVNGGTGTSSTLTGLMRGSVSAMTAAELSGDATTSGSNAVTVVGINGTLLSGLATGILKITHTTGVPSIAGAADVDALYTGAGKCYLFKGTTPGTNDGCDNPAGSGTVTTTGSPANGELTIFSGSTSITNGNLTGDVTTSNTTATTVAAIQGTTVTLTSPVAGQMLAITSGPTIVNAFPGVPIDVESGTPYTVRGDGTGSDRVSVVQTTNNTTSTAVTVPQAGSTGFDHYFTFVAINSGSVVATYTPQTSTINGNTTLKLVGQVTGHNPEGVFWYSLANGSTNSYIGFEILPTDANGLLAAEGFPGLTGDVTASSGSFATTVTKVNGAAIPTSAAVLASNGSNQLIAATVHGNTSTVQLESGATTTNDCAKFDANGNTVDAGAACAGGTPTFPITVAGTVTSGGIPCFTATTTESSSALLAANAIVQGGGAGVCPTTGNGDFTIDATAHTLKSGANGLVDFSGIAGATGFKVPVIAGATAGAAGVVDYDSTNKLTHIATNNADSIAAATTSTSTTTTQALFATATAGVYNPRAIATGDLPTSGIPNVVYNNATNTATSAMTLDMSAATGATALKVPVIAGATAGAAGVIDYDSTNKLTHVATNNVDSIVAATTSTSTTTTQALFATATAGVYNPRAIATGDLPNSVVYNNATNTGTSAMTLDMHAATTANALQIPVGAGLTVSANGALGFDSTNKMVHDFNNGVDSFIAAMPASGTYTNGDCIKFGVASGNISLVDTGAPCSAGTGNPPLDKTASGLANPTADATFTYPASSTTGFTFAGTAPASVSTSTGTNATSLFNVSGVTGGADSNATGTAGIGSSPSISGGTGGAGTGTNTVGGAGGTVALNGGNGGASAGTGNNSNGGGVTVSVGQPGTGGSGTAGTFGAFTVTGTALGSTASGNGLAVGTIVNVAGITGQASSATTGVTGGTGSAVSINGGTGGAVSGATGTNTGGTGGGISIAAGAGGNGTAGNDSGGNGGNITLTPGAGGTKTGSGTAGTGGSLIVSNLGNGAVLSSTTGAISSTAGTAGQILTSKGASTLPGFADFPETLFVPAANCNNTTAGAGWSIGSGGTVTCRAGTNNTGGYIAITDTSSTFAQFTLAIPEDWDTGTNPYIRVHLAYPGTDGASAHTIIPQIKVSCTGTNGSGNDDITFNAAHSLSTITLSSATANLVFSTSNVQLNSTDVTGCNAGGLMIVQIGRATDTATSAANFYGATVTIPRLLSVQAN